MEKKTVEKISLELYPTPLQELPHISRILGGGKRFFIKRDDLCGIGFGGNKVRKLEYLLAEALAQNCDSIVTGGGSHSNQTLATAACGGKIGIPVHLVVPDTTVPAIRHFGELLGASLHIVSNKNGDTVEKGIRAVARELKAQGKKPYVIPRGASNTLGVISFVDAMGELYVQANEQNIQIDHVLCCGATGNTYAGIALGTKLYRPSATASVLSIARRFCKKSTLCKLAWKAEEQLGCNTGIAEEDLHVYFSCGKGAEKPTAKGNDAVRLMAQTEGIFLDPFYTGKAFAGIWNLNQQGVFQDGQSIVFLHTGGTAALIGSLAK